MFRPGGRSFLRGLVSTFAGFRAGKRIDIEFALNVFSERRLIDDLAHLPNAFLHADEITFIG
jgi:hypothetical protein